ncbi:M16 family metallopeptidase [Pseudooceanicola nanhaiensis]|uniref:M16 family metallopeptidase n=1 Tax=Pseudooceanicola nanhaiensis TaxID=375761 RepID=UPI001CD4B3F4|nr:pitrilysin family protein [Pseudooceanicola nanhaiensis]MCA0918871.1 insulinase family protein [Pseudooceanicola nanhaiensis]
MQRVMGPLLALGLGAALPVVASAAEPGLNDLVTDFTLSNGMEVVVIEDHRAPVVQQMVWYRSGAADETPGVSGIAHFLEHLMFKATKNMASGELSKTVAENGGTDNAFTGQDYTAYFQRVAADRLELMMKMESDRMVNLNLSEDDIATERQVIIEERNQRTESNPQALYREQAMAAQYLNSPYGIPVIGWRHEMEALSRQDALDYYKTYYAPNNAILVVSGDVTPEGVKELAEKYYGVLPANPDLPERVRPQEPPQMAERRLTFRDARIAQPYVSRTYLAPERDAGDQKEAAALTLLAELLGGGQTSYLTQKLQYDSQTAVYASAYYDGTSLDDALFGVYIVPSQGISLEEGEAALDQALADFMKDGVDTEELDRIKMQIRASQIYARDDVDALARRYGSALTQGLTVQDVQDWPQILQDVTEDDIMAAAREVLNRDHAVTGWLTGEEVTQ